MPRPYDPELPELSSETPDDRAVAAPPAPAQAAPAPVPTPQAVDPPRAPAREEPPQERWAFRSRTIQRMIVAGIMFYIASNHAALIPYVDQTLAADTVQMIFDLFGTLFLGAAARGRQIAGPEKLYWLPRARA